MSFLPCVEVEPRGAANASVIWLHGLGADGHDFEPIVPELALPGNAAVRFVFPHAPVIPVTINGGVPMRAWYDILELSVERHVDLEQLRQSARSVARLVDREIERGIASERIILAGFSQGGAVACEVALTYSQPLAGLLSLSSYFATAGTCTPSEVNAALPILVCHGTHDPVVPEALGHRSYQIFQAMRHTVEYRTYPMGHEVCLDEIRDISRWLGERLAR